MRRREGDGFDAYADLTLTRLPYNPPRKSAYQKAAAPAGVSTRGATASRLSDLSNQKLLLFFFASRESCKCHKQAGQKHHYRSLGRLLSGLRQRCQRFHFRRLGLCQLPVSLNRRGRHALFPGDHRFDVGFWRLQATRCSHFRCFRFGRTIAIC